MVKSEKSFTQNFSLFTILFFLSYPFTFIPSSSIHFPSLGEGQGGCSLSQIPSFLRMSLGMAFLLIKKSMVL